MEVHLGRGRSTAVRRWCARRCVPAGLFLPGALWAEETAKPSYRDGGDTRTDGAGYPFDLPLRKLIFTYDDQGRKVRTQEGFWTIWGDGGGYEPEWDFPAENTLHYAYSGFNVIAEADQHLTKQKTYLWGLDEGEMNDFRNTAGWSSIGRGETQKTSRLDV